MCRQAPEWLTYCGLPDAWADRPAWTILDTAFGDGTQFLETWHAWRAHPQRPRILHYVAIAPAHSALASVLAHHLSNPDDALCSLATSLVQACAGLSNGFNRILLDGGQISLTLCLGALAPMLAEHTFHADTLFLGASVWDKWSLKLLSRRCPRGTRFHAAYLAPDAHTLFAEAGFRLAPPQAQAAVANNLPALGAATTGVFDPPWAISTSRQGPRGAPPAIARCAIVGAGLAGATVAHALALRGWQVTVFDQHAAPAGGASGLPAGLVVPSISADDNPRSRISRSGTQLMLQHAKRLLVQGQDWEPTGVQEHHSPNGSSGKATIHWHPQAAWIKPAVLVRALLKHPGITFIGNTEVGALDLNGTQWVLRDPQGAELGRAEVLVLCGALECAQLLQALPPNEPLGAHVQANVRALHAVYGTLTRGQYGPHTGPQVLQTFPPFPINGNGGFLPKIPQGDDFEWLLGATFETSEPSTNHIAAQHAVNLERLQHLAPTTAAALTPVFNAGHVSHWSGTRCASHDRLPMVGPLQADLPLNLWMSAGMGSRGLSFSAVCAELVVAQLSGEPLPMEVSLTRSLDANRVRRQRGRTRAVAVD